MPICAASAVARPRLGASSLRRIADTWWSTVRTDTTSRSAISAFCRPSPTSARTSSSRGRQPRRMGGARPAAAEPPQHGPRPEPLERPHAVVAAGPGAGERRLVARSRARPSIRRRRGDPRRARARTAPPRPPRPARTRPRPPRRELAQRPAAAVRRAASQARSVAAIASASSPRIHACSARPHATGASRCSSPVPAASASASSSASSAPGSPRRARTRPSVTSAGMRRSARCSDRSAPRPRSPSRRPSGRGRPRRAQRQPSIRAPRGRSRRGVRPPRHRVASSSAPGVARTAAAPRFVQARAACSSSPPSSASRRLRSSFSLPPSTRMDSAAPTLLSGVDEDLGVAQRLGELDGRAAPALRALVVPVEHRQLRAVGVRHRELRPGRQRLEPLDRLRRVPLGGSALRPVNQCRRESQR